MNREYYIDQSNLVLLKKENGLIYQYSFTKHFWYSLPELQGIENTYLFKEILLIVIGLPPVDQNPTIYR